MLKVRCTLTDCAHYNPAHEGPPFCLCSHPDKPHYLNGLQCPLYRMDWTKQTEKLTAIRNRMKNKAGQG